MQTVGKFAIVLSSLIFALGFPTLPVQGAEPAATSTTAASSAVTVELATSGYEFTPLIGGLIPLPGTSNTSLPPQVIAVHVTVHNQTTTDIPYTLYSGITFEFTVYDAADKVVWDSLPMGLPQFVMLTSLKAGDSLHGMAAVPLFIKGVALKPGVYTLQAKLFGSGKFSASTTFAVKPVIALN